MRVLTVEHCDGLPERRCSVLIVEDDQSVSALLVGLFDALDCTIHVAYDGYTALRLARSERPTVITLDLGIPLLDGLGVLCALKAAPTTARIPILVISAQTEDLSRADRRRAAAVVSKPFDLDQIVRGFQAALVIA